MYGGLFPLIQIVSNGASLMLAFKQDAQQILAMSNQVFADSFDSSYWILKNESTNLQSWTQTSTGFGHQMA